MTKNIGTVIRELRCSRGLTQEQLSEHLNITAQAISKWENNIGMPDISQVVPIAHFFGVSTDVLFGVSEDQNVDEVEHLLEQATASEALEEEYDLLQKALQLYPGDVRLLLELLACGQCRLADGDQLKPEERQRIFAECQRAGRLILSYSKDLDLLFHTTEWMIKLYCEMGEVGQAGVLAETLPSVIGMNKEGALARICECEKKNMDAAQYYEANAAQAQKRLIHSLILCGNLYAKAKEKERAVTVYCYAIDLMECFFASNPFPAHTALQKNLTRTLERCRKMLINFQN